MQIFSINDFTIEQAKYKDHKDELKQMCKGHWDEVGMPGADGLELNIDDWFYYVSGETGGHIGFTIRYKGLLIGYFSVMIHDHQQHKGIKFASNDGLFIIKKYRGYRTYKVVKRLIQEAMDILKKDHGVQYFNLSENSNHSLEFLAKDLGMTKSAVIYTKRL